MSGSSGPEIKGSGPGLGSSRVAGGGGERGEGRVCKSWGLQGREARAAGGWGTCAGLRLRAPGGGTMLPPSVRPLYCRWTLSRGPASVQTLHRDLIPPGETLQTRPVSPQQQPGAARGVSVLRSASRSQLASLSAELPGSRRSGRALPSSAPSCLRSTYDRAELEGQEESSGTLSDMSQPTRARAPPCTQGLVQPPHLDQLSGLQQPRPTQA